MSASDNTSIKKYNSMNNQFSRKSSGNETEKKKINVIKNVSNTDVFGFAVEKTWFNIPITNTCVSANATIQSSIITTPIIYKIPDMTIPVALKFRNKPNIISFDANGITISEIVLEFSGVFFTNVNLSRDGISIATNITGTTYTDTGLTVNTSYTYVITPINSCNSCNNSGITSEVTQKTLPNLTSLSISSASSSQIVLAYTGNYTDVSISRNGSVIATGVAGTSYTDAYVLIGNTYYTYIVIPHNSAGAGTSLTITQKTLPNLTSLSISSFTTSLLLTYTGNYINVSISRDGSVIATGVTGTSYTDASGLTANTSYTYDVTPYDISGNAGITSTITKKTLPNLTSLSISGTSSIIVLSYTGNYTNVSISRNSTIIATGITTTTFTDSSGLIGNTSYTYIVTPYDTSGNAGITSTITQKTLPNLTSLSISSFTESQIVLAYTGNYNNVSISRNGTTISTNITGTSYTDASGLTANTSYTYIVTPYDTSGNAGIIIYTITQKTLPNLTSLSISSFTETQIVLAYSGNYNSVSISRNGTTISTGITGTSFTDASILTANTSYTYIVTPYNISGNAGITSTITQKTLPNLTSLSISSFTSTQIVLAYTGNFTNVSISRNGTTIATGITTTTYTNVGLTPNTSYTYIVTPYNSSSIEGSTLTLTITQSTSI